MHAQNIQKKRKNYDSVENRFQYTSYGNSSNDGLSQVACNKKGYILRLGGAGGDVRCGIVLNGCIVKHHMVVCITICHV